MYLFRGCVTCDVMETEIKVYWMEFVLDGDFFFMTGFHAFSGRLKRKLNVFITFSITLTVAQNVVLKQCFSTGGVSEPTFSSLS